MTNKKETVAIITARGGSKGIPKKNIADLAGKPLIQYTIEAALESKNIDCVMVSSDDAQILKISRELGAETIKRPAEISGDAASSSSAIEHALQELGRQGRPAQTVVLLQPTSPLRDARDIDLAFETLKKSNGSSLISVYQPPETPLKCFVTDKNGFLKGAVNEKFPFMPRQQLPKAFLANGAIYIFTADEFMAGREIPVTGAVPYVMPVEKSIDIDTREDLDRVAALLTAGEPKGFRIAERMVGGDAPPLVIVEIGINHEGSLETAKEMVDAAARAGAEVIKHQTHVVEDEMVASAKKVIPGNAKESIYEIMARCALSEPDEIKLKEYVESKGLIFISTPFSRAAADRLRRMDVPAYKIGSGECNNYPLIEHIASFDKPVILSTGMNDIASIRKSVAILRRQKIPYALLHCTNVYPTPPHLVRLGAMTQLAETFPDAIIGLSDHTTSNHACLGAVALGADILERHFTDRMDRPGPDIECSMDPAALQDLVQGSKIIKMAGGGTKGAVAEEQPTIDFAFSCVVSIAPIKKGARFSQENIWVKRPGTGELKADRFEELLGMTAARDIPDNYQLKISDVEELTTP